MEAARIIAGELPDLPYLAELPGRGPGADITGRAAALLVDIPMELAGPRGWRIAERPGRDMRRARTMLSSDLDAMEEVLDGYSGVFKIQVVGPLTLAATIEQPRSLNAALADPGLVADLASSLAEGAALHVAEVAKRVPKATLIVQFDEPALPSVLHGAVPTPSGLGRVRAVDEEIARDRLRRGAGRHAEIHSRSLLRSGPPVRDNQGRWCGRSLVRPQPAAAGGLRRLRGDGGGGPRAADRRAADERVRQGPDSARQARRDESQRPVPSDTAGIVRDLWHKMDLPAAQCAPQVVITPACGLPGASPKQARDALRWCREAAQILPEMMDELT